MPPLDWLTRAPFAHRGLHDIAAGVPENSLAAFEAAAAAGYGIELDVRLAADATPVVFHDATLERLTDLAGPLAARTSAELRAARLCRTAHGVPSLAESLELVAGRVPVLVEVKNGWRRAGAAERAIRAVLEGCRGDLAVLSFNPFTLGWFRRHAPDLARGQNIAAGSGGRGPGRRALDPIRRLLARPHFLSYQIDGLGPEIAGLARARGLPLITWTVRGQDDLDRARRYADNFMFEGMRP